MLQKFFGLEARDKAGDDEGALGAERVRVLAASLEVRDGELERDDESWQSTTSQLASPSVSTGIEVSSSDSVPHAASSASVHPSSSSSESNPLQTASPSVSTG